MEQENTLYSVEQVLQLLPIGRTLLYQEIRSGRIRTVRIGVRRLISAAALAEYVELISTESAETRA